MSSEAALLHAITANRADDTARLVYADWLTENDQPDRAAYLRLQVELVREWWYDTPCTDLYARMAELSERIDLAWLATVRRCTTPAPPVNVEEVFPDLRGKGKTTVRLHPRPGKAPIDASKIGGMFLWPKKEPWPVCSDCDVPYVTALQLRKEDVPELDFPPDTDLFQLLWCPRGQHGDGDDSCCPRPAIYWRERAEVTQWRKKPPRWNERRELYNVGDAVMNSCRIYPERATEYAGYSPPHIGYPDYGAALPAAFRSAVEVVRQFPKAGDLSPPTDAESLYYSWLNEADGSKVGGYPHRNQGGGYPRCACGTDMEYLVSFASREYDADSWGRWVPIEDRPIACDTEYYEWATVCEPLGCMFGRCATMNVFVCREHREWPVCASID